MDKLTIPNNLRVQVGDEYAKFYFDPVDGAAGYILSFYKDPEETKSFKTRVTEKSGKLVRGFVNGREYYVSICAFVRDEDCNEIRMDESERISFTTISDSVKAPKKICLRSGERARIAYEYSDDVTYPEFESNNPSVVTVNDNGELTAFRKGEADITITFPNGVSAVTSVSVNRDYSSYMTAKGRIVITGDLMCNAWMQRKASEDNYDFSPAFKLVRERLGHFDHLIGNLETVVYDNAPYEWEMLRTSRGTPNCNTPSTFLRALKDTGFDVLVTANNHNLDCGSEGLKESISLIKRIGILNSGTYFDNPIYFYSAGIKIALISLTMVSNLIDKAVDDQIAGHYSDEYCSTLIKEAKSSGAEYIIVYMHWGNMNEYGLTDVQKNTAQFIADTGADLIVGCHPHVVQRAMYLETADRREVPCVFSLGNFCTSMKELTGNRDSVALILDMSRDGENIVTHLSYIPFYSRLFKKNIMIEPVDHPLGYEQLESLARTNYVLGPDIPILKPRFTCFGSVILRKILKDVDRFESHFENILLSPASLSGKGHPEFANTEYSRVNTDISKENIFEKTGNPGDYCLVDFYAAASLKLLKLNDNFYTASDAFMLSDFYHAHENEFVVIDQPDATDVCTKYIETMARKILAAYDHDRIILIRSRIPDVSVVDASVYHTEKSHVGLNRRIEWLEDLFIIYADPIIIDISSEYFTDNTETGSVSEYEEYYYKDVLGILDRITQGDKQRSFREPSAELWYRRVLKYYDHAKEKNDWDTICNNKKDAVSELIRYVPVSFLSEHSSEIIYLREHHIADLGDVPYLEYMSIEMKETVAKILDELDGNTDDSGDQSASIP